jgi:hypothetical protein
MMSFDAYQRGSVDEGKKFAEKLDVLISAMNQQKNIIKFQPSAK